MAAVERVLIVGGGIAGLSLAIALRDKGIAADVVELASRVVGVGITFTGSALRALNSIKLAQSCVDNGFSINFFQVNDAAGKRQASNPLPAVAGPGFPAAVGMQRPVFADLLTRTAKARGATIRHGLTVDRLEQDTAEVHVHLTDGSTGHYDLVVGADGIYSSIRSMVFGDSHRPCYAGSGVWRFMTERHPTVDQLDFYVAPKIKAGFIPLSDKLMYMLSTLHFPINPRMDESKSHELYSEVLKEFTAPVVVDVRARMRSPESVIWRPFETLLLPSWHRGRVILIGDAAHSMTPHLSAGGGVAIEDAVVLADNLQEDAPIEVVLDRFMERRFERVRSICDTSLQICKLEQAENPDIAEIYKLTMRGYAVIGEAF